MERTQLQKKLFEISDEKYREFISKLAPTVPKDNFIGVKVPKLRKMAPAFEKGEEYESFICNLPHRYYEENLFHSVLIVRVKNYEKAVELTEEFLPYVDNWAVCDTLRPRVFAKHKNELYPLVLKWIASKKTYTCRFGLDMLMTHYLDDEFKPEQLEIPINVESEEYYVRMMIAWYYATALAKQWDATIPYIEKHRLPDWTHKKTIQKACESYRITPEQKKYLKTLK